jgi:hypothetical protein
MMGGERDALLSGHQSWVRWCLGQLLRANQGVDARLIRAIIGHADIRHTAYTPRGRRARVCRWRQARRAIYTGSWLLAAKEFTDRPATAIRTRERRPARRRSSRLSAPIGAADRFRDGVVGLTVALSLDLFRKNLFGHLVMLNCSTKVPITRRSDRCSG